jgi:hypothetical protein
LDAALGLALLYFLLSTITSHLNEIVAGALSRRAKQLETGVRALLGNDALTESVLNHPLITGLAGKRGRRPSYIPSSAFDLGVIGAAAAKLPDGSARDALVRIVASAQGDMLAARTGVEAWYDAAMERVSGIYKRNTQWIILGIGAIVTVVLGADTIGVATALSQEQGVRAALTGAAQSSSGTGLEDALNTLQQVSFPVGWTFPPQTLFGWSLKVAGLLITTLAVSLGAPFWFDLFKLFMNPRQTGPVPATTAPRAADTQAP